MEADESIEEDMKEFEDDWNLDYNVIDTEDEEEDNNSKGWSSKFLLFEKTVLLEIE